MSNETATNQTEDSAKVDESAAIQDAATKPVEIAEVLDYYEERDKEATDNFASMADKLGTIRKKPAKKDSEEVEKASKDETKDKVDDNKDDKAESTEVDKLVDSITDDIPDIDNTDKPETFTQEQVDKMLADQKTELEKSAEDNADNTKDSEDSTKVSTTLTDMTDDQFEDIISTKENFIKFQTEREKDIAITASETMLKTLGPAITNTITSRIEIINAAKDMFDKNPDLVEHRADIVKAADQIATKNPKAPYEAIMEASADYVRKTKNIKKQETSQSNANSDDKSNSTNKGKFPNSSGSNTGGAGDPVKILDPHDVRRQDGESNFKKFNKTKYAV